MTSLLMILTVYFVPFSIAGVLYALEALFRKD